MKIIFLASFCVLSFAAKAEPFHSQQDLGSAKIGPHHVKSCTVLIPRIPNEGSNKDLIDQLVAKGYSPIVSDLLVVTRARSNAINGASEVNELLAMHESEALSGNAFLKFSVDVSPLVLESTLTMGIAGEPGAVLFESHHWGLLRSVRKFSASSFPNCEPTK